MTCLEVDDSVLLGIRSCSMKIKPIARVMTKAPMVRSVKPAEPHMHYVLQNSSRAVTCFCCAGEDCVGMAYKQRPGEGHKYVKLEIIR